MDYYFSVKGIPGLNRSRDVMASMFLSDEFVSNMKMFWSSYIYIKFKEE